MTKDIASREDIDALMTDFYQRAMSDPAIGHFFTAAMHFDLEKHLPIIGDFWETLLFGNDVYRKHRRNPLQVHAGIDRKAPLQPQHFQRWLVLFAESVDESFAGMRAEFAKQRSRAIASRMMEFLGAIAAAEPAGIAGR